MSKKSEAVSDGLTIYHYIVIFDILARLVFENRTDTFLLVTGRESQRASTGERELKNLGLKTFQ